MAGRPVRMGTRSQISRSLLSYDTRTTPAIGVKRVEDKRNESTFHRDGGSRKDFMCHCWLLKCMPGSSFAAVMVSATHLCRTSFFPVPRISRSLVLISLVAIRFVFLFNYSWCAGSIWPRETSETRQWWSNDRQLVLDQCSDSKSNTSLSASNFPRPEVSLNMDS